MNFLDILFSPKKTLNIFNDVVLKEGDIINIYGEPYIGKTLTCYWVISQNPDKSLIYFDSENSLYPYLNTIASTTPILYTIQNDIKIIKAIIETNMKNFDYFIIDSLTATDLEQGHIILADLCGIIKKNNKNLIIVSQVRGKDDRIFYENKRFLDFCSYQVSVTEAVNGCLINGKYLIDKKFLDIKVEVVKSITHS